MTFCEGEIAIISCVDNNALLSIQLANYGRFSLSVCNPTADTSLDTNCFSNKTLQILKNKCDGKNECDISVDNTVFGNHCPETSKYLDIQYMCATAITNTTASSTLCKCTVEESDNQDNQICATTKFEHDDIMFFCVLLLITCIGGVLIGALALYLYFTKYYNIIKKSDAIHHRQNSKQPQNQEDAKTFLQINRNFDAKRKESIEEYDEIL